jgi:hypothetical protein
MAVDGHWDRADLRSWMREPRRTRAPRVGRQQSLLACARQFRAALGEADATRLTENERRELRSVFRELAMLARAPSEKRERVFPPLPVVRHG